MLPMSMNAFRGALRRASSLLLAVGLIWAGCASSGDVEKMRQEREQAKAKMRAELQQERDLAASMEKESETRKTEADKLAKALGGGTAGGVAAKALAPRQTAGMTLTAALANASCKLNVPANPPNPAVTALYIDGTTSCSNVTVGTADATFTASAPLMPVIVGSGGTLTLQDQAMTLYASSFLVRNGGTMQAGTAATPIQSHITIAMAGNSSAALPPTTGDTNPNARDITVMDGGVLALYGGKGLSATPDGTQNNPAKNSAFINTLYGTKSWTYLAAPAGPAKYNAQNAETENVSAPTPVGGDTMLALANQVDWQVGDWISVATTSFSSHQTEIVQICGISSAMTLDPRAAGWGMPLTVSYLTLCQKLQHYHYGGLVPTSGFFPAGTKQVVAKGGTAIDVSHQAKSFYDDHERNYGIDERAEVALLSRNIKLTSVAGQTTDANNFIGGHLVAMVTGTTSPTLALVGVEIEKFGQGLVGRYPVHLHQLPSGSTVLVQDVSVHHSYNKCYVVHGTGNANLYNNVCVRTVGQGVYLEDGTNITGNQFMRNHIAGTMAAGTTYSYPQQNGSQYWDGDNLQNLHMQGGAITNATNANPIVVTTSGTAPVTNAQVVIAGVAGNTAANNTTSNPAWTVTNTGANTFSLNGSTGNGAFTNATWTVSGLNTITGISQDSITQLLVIQTQSVPTAGKVTISGTGTAADGSWTITNVVAGPPKFSLVGSKGLSPGSYSCCNGKWSASNTISGATNANPIVIASPTALASGAQITIAGVQGNTAANGSWTVTNIDATHFSLNGSTGNGAFAGAAWQTSGSSPYWYTVSGIPDTSFSGANMQGPIHVGPDLYHPGGFWITNLGNTFVNNSVAGCQAMGRGYWLLTQNGQTYAYPEFTGNRVHGCYNGIDTQPDNVNASNPQPTMNGTANDQAPVLLLNDNTVTRSRQRAFWGRGIFFTLHNNRFATNPYGFSLLGGGGPEGNLPGFWGMAHENVIAGMTRNNVERYPGCANTGLNFVQECTDVTISGGVSYWGNYPNPNPGSAMNIQGYSYYDGPARIEHNRFVNFRFDPTGIQTDPAARLLTKTDIALIKTNLLGQLHGAPTLGGQATTLFNGYAGDPATGWIQSNAQSVPPTQYIKDSIWDNVDFKHQVYTEAVNLGVFNDGDKTTVILDKDSQLTGLRVVDASGTSHHDVVPVSLNNLDYFATDFTVDEPHARGPNDFRATSLMSPHKYATLNIESVNNPPYGGNPPNTSPYMPTLFRVVIQRDMPAYDSSTYPSLFLNGRGQNPIYEPFVMDRMGYTVYAETGTEHESSTQSLTSFQSQLLFSYTDPGVKKAGDYFINRIAVYQPVVTPGNIKVYRIRRQWGQQYTGGLWPPNYKAPGSATTCDGVFFANQANAATRWQDCLNRANNVAPYADGVTLTAATDWKSFDQSYKNLLAGTTTIAQFIANQTYYYDQPTNLLYFYMIEDSPVQRQYAPYGTCGGGSTQYAANVAAVEQIKSFSDPGSVQAALDASCLVNQGAPQPIDLFTCGENGCAAYLVDLSAASVAAPPAPTTPITGASTTSPIVITTGGSAPPTGTQVVISGVQGNTAANGIWTVTYTSTHAFSLNNSAGSGTYTSGSGAWSSCCAPPHPITGADYSGWNQYHFVYGTSAQQPNGLPVAANAAIGNTAPPADGTALAGRMTPTDGTPPPTGDQVTYTFLALDGSMPIVTENFRYRCVTTPPWAPVNARGAYPPAGHFTYPLANDVCTVPHSQHK